MIGKLLGKRYEILEQIGSGGMAIVYKAKCRLLHRFVAVKVLKDEFAEDQEFVEKFRRESQAAASLSHPNIVNIFDVGTDQDGDKIIHYIVMEYIKGDTLKEYINKNKKLNLEETINFGSQIAIAIKDAHKNKIIHRDIKSQNIMIDENHRIKVMDFGIARAATSSTITTTSEAIGSVHYFSPEQARGGYTDEKSDIYSFGIVMYEMVTGELPYKGQSPITVALKHVQEEIVRPSEIEPGIPKELESLILKCVQKRQVDRYNSMDEVLMVLNKLAKRYNINTVESNISKYERNMEDTSSHTMVLPNLGPKASSPKKRKTKNNKSKESKKMIFSGILMAFIFTSLVFFGKDKVKGLFASQEILMPNLIGMMEEDARELIEDEKELEFRVLSRVGSDEYAPGQIIWQDVQVGGKLKKGYPVQVKISEGSGPIKVPKLIGKNIFDAEKTLLALGLGIGSPTYKVSDQQPDIILSQDIPENEEVEKGTRIGIVVSRGVVNDKIKMPNIIGMSLEQAKIKLNENNLILGSSNSQDSDKDKGTVINQKPNSGVELDKNTVVDIVISSGKVEEKPEKPVEEPPTEPEKPKNENISRTFATRVNGESVQVKVIRVYEGVSETVYNGTHGQSEGDFDITISGPKGSKFDIYHDGSYQTSISN